MKIISTVFSLLCLISLSSLSKESTNVLPSHEIYIIDIPSIPTATGKKGSTYSAKLFIIDNESQKIHGPYRGSSYPNSQESKDKNGVGTDKPNIVVNGVHLFNNQFGHKGGTVKGLNLINNVGERKVSGFSWSKKPSTVSYANVHTGFSDNGNFNSRGSMGCMTIHPKDVASFFSHFDFSKKTKGDAKGVVHIFRANENRRNLLIDQIKSLYKD